MAHIVDLEEPLCGNTLFNSVETPGALASTFLSTLAAAKGCGMLIMIDKILKKQNLSDKAARLALDLLRSINRQSVIVTPSLSDDPVSFVAKTLIAAKVIVEKSNNGESPLFVAAKRLTDSLQAYNEKDGNIPTLENTWQDFSLHYYREKLYQFIAR